MIVVVTVSLIAILLTYYDSRGKLKNGMSLGFILVTILGCIHYNYGNDYKGYYDMYNEIIQMPLRFDYLVDNTYNHEPGWVVLNHLFKHFGGFLMMVAVLNIIQNIIYYNFIKDNVQKSNWAFAIMIYLMSTSLYILNFSMMRQGLSIALFVYAWKYIKTTRILPALVILLIASTIHFSAQLLIPFALLPLLPLKNKSMAITFVVLLGAFYSSSVFLYDTFASLSALDELQNAHHLDSYSKDQGDDLSSIGLGFIINMIPFVVAILALIHKGSVIDKTKRMLITISLVSFIIAPFGQILPIIGRYAMYFNAFNVAAIPYIYSLYPKWNQALTALYVLMLVYGYYSFFYSPVWIENYSTFHTIFSVL